MEYHKLVRDKIPELIKDAGKRCRIRVLSKEEYRSYLEKKLEEEVQEYFQSTQTGELLDILEVIYALGEERGLGIEDLEAKRIQKQKERGAFQKRILLLEVEE